MDAVAGAGNFQYVLEKHKLHVAQPTTHTVSSSLSVCVCVCPLQAQVALTEGENGKQFFSVGTYVTIL